LDRAPTSREVHELETANRQNAEKIRTLITHEIASKI